MATASSQRWLFGPVPDLLLGCGGLYLVIFTAFCWAGPELRLTQPSVLAPVLILLFSMPHYAATLLRVYENRADRRRYALFAVHTTLALLALFVAGLHLHAVGVALVTLYISWSPWHYTGQNYGLGLMFLGRRGVAVDPALKRWIWLSFVLSFVLTFLVMHQADATVADNAVSYLASDVGADAPIRFQPLGIPTAWTHILVPAVGLACLAALAVAGTRLLRRGSLGDLGPTALLVTTQALWFSVPWACRFFGVSLGVDPLEPRHRTYYFLWIAVGHAVQYLWVSAYYARRSPRWQGYAHYFGKTLLAGTAIWTLPLVLFAPWSLGSVSYDAGLFLVLAAAINLHHFILDGAIWKLRDGRVAQTLLRGADQQASGEEADRIWLRRGVWVTAALGFALALGFNHEHLSFGANVAGGRLAQASRNLDHLVWFGAESARLRRDLGRRLLESGRPEAARRELERSLALKEDPSTYAVLGRVHEMSQRWSEAAQSYESALALAPDQPALLYQSATAWLELDELERARSRLERALALRPDHRPSRTRLAEVERRIAQRSGEPSPHPVQ